tara:strand:+ start:171 stop:347 length:177 start_codon:yes stop_codon:yes gene_type:complete
VALIVEPREEDYYQNFEEALLRVEPRVDCRNRPGHYYRLEEKVLVRLLDSCSKVQEED